MVGETLVPIIGWIGIWETTPIHVDFVSACSIGRNSKSTLYTEIDISVRKLLGFETFAILLRVSVSENLVSKK